MFREEFRAEKCGGVRMLDHKSFFPVSGDELSSLREKGEWYKYLSRSYGVHMFHTSLEAQSTRSDTSLNKAWFRHG